VDDHVVGKVLAALGLDVVDRLDPHALHANHRLLPEGRHALARELVGAGDLEQLALVVRDEADQLPEAGARLGVRDGDHVGGAAALACLRPAPDPRVDPQVEQERLDAVGQAGGGGGERDVGQTRPVGAQLDRALGLEERAQVRGLGLAAGPQDHGRHRMIRARPEQAVLLDERPQALPVETDAVDVEARGPGLHRPDVVVDALEDAVHPLHDEVHLVLVDGRELDGQAVVGREPVLAHEAVGLQPPHQGGLVHEGLLGARADLGPGGEAQGRARLHLVHPPPGADAVDDGPDEMVAGRLHRHPVLELDPEDRLLAVLQHRHHPGRPGTLLAAVVDFEADQVLGHDLADGQGALRGRDQGVVGLAGVRLGALVGRAGPGQDPGVRVDVIVALGRPAEAVGVVETGVEPLG